MAIMIPEATEAVTGTVGGTASKAASRARKPRVRGSYSSTGKLSYGPAGRAVSAQNRAAARPASVVQGQVIGRGTAPSASTGSTASTASGGTSKPSPKKKPSRIRRYAGYGGTGYKASKPAFRSLTGREYGGVMLAEYLAGILILAAGMIIRGSSNGYLAVMSGFLTRATALTGVFFILFLLGPTKAGKAAMYFGALVDLSIVFTATQQNIFSDLAKVVQGQPLAVDSATVDANTNIAEPAAGPVLTDAS
jgi:hypothetical protein